MFSLWHSQIVWMFCYHPASFPWGFLVLCLFDFWGPWAGTLSCRLMVNKKHCCLHLLANTSMCSCGAILSCVLTTLKGLGWDVQWQKRFMELLWHWESRWEVGKIPAQVSVLGIILVCCGSLSCQSLGCCQVSWQEGHGHKWHWGSVLPKKSAFYGQGAEWGRS